MKKLLTLFVASILFAAQATAATFDDVSTKSTNYIAIEYLVSIGTLEGYEDGSFQPDRTINRAELMKVLVAGQGIDPDPEIYKNCYPDVTTDWYAKYVCYATEQNWVSGYPDNTFRPSQTVNKVEAVKMLVNALGLGDQLPATVTTLLFNDTDNNGWYAPYLYVAKNLGLLEVRDVNFEPSGEMNRGGVAENIFRTLVVQERGVGEYSATDRDAFLESHELTKLLPVKATTETYEVERVVDGDTIVLKNGESVRLLGVDAPETGACFDSESTAHLESLIGEGSVRIESDEINDDRDQYDRLLRYVYIGDTLINLKMVEDGYARHYNSYEITFDAEFEDAEESANASNLPIWEACYAETGTGELIISNVFYDGEVYRVESDEYVEITNNGTASINLDGYYIMGSSGGEKYIFDDVALAASESIKVYTNQGDYSFENDSAIWSNSGETVYFYDSSGALIDSYAY